MSLKICTSTVSRTIASQCQQNCQKLANHSLDLLILNYQLANNAWNAQHNYLTMLDSLLAVYSKCSYIASYIDKRIWNLCIKTCMGFSSPIKLSPPGNLITYLHSFHTINGERFARLSFCIFCGFQEYRKSFCEYYKSFGIV